MAVVKYYNVRNRSASRVCYSIPEDHIRRTFAPGETKRITGEELTKLTWQSGGLELMEAFLQIQNEEALAELNINAQPEYFMTEEQIIELLKNGTIDEFLDCLDFAPVGVMELIQKYAVQLPLSDYNKRKALKDKTGFDIDKVISNIESEKAEAASTTANVTPASTPTPTAGRRTTPKYNVVSKDTKTKENN